eukprot:4262163-Pleurochrysis_carterae.AAC.1
MGADWCGDERLSGQRSLHGPASPCLKGCQTRRRHVRMSDMCRSKPSAFNHTTPGVHEPLWPFQPALSPHSLKCTLCIGINDVDLVASLSLPCPTDDRPIYLPQRWPAHVRALLTTCALIATYLLRHLSTRALPTEPPASLPARQPASPLTYILTCPLTHQPT